MNQSHVNMLPSVKVFQKTDHGQPSPDTVVLIYDVKENLARREELNLNDIIESADDDHDRISHRLKQYCLAQLPLRRDPQHYVNKARRWTPAFHDCATGRVDIKIVHLDLTSMRWKITAALTSGCRTKDEILRFTPAFNLFRALAVDSASGFSQPAEDIVKSSAIEWSHELANEKETAARKQRIEKFMRTFEPSPEPCRAYPDLSRILPPFPPAHDPYNAFPGGIFPSLNPPK